MRIYLTIATAITAFLCGCGEKADVVASGSLAVKSTTQAQNVGPNAKHAIPQNSAARIEITGSLDTDTKPSENMSLAEKRAFYDELASLYFNNYGYEKSLELLERLPFGDSYGPARNSLIHNLMGAKPTEFLKYLASHYDGSEQNKLDFLGSTLISYVNTRNGGLSDAWKSVEGLELSAESKRYLLARFLIAKARAAPEEMREFLKTDVAIPSPERDAALTSLVREFQKPDLDSAIQILNSITTAASISSAARNVGYAFAIHGDSKRYAEALPQIPNDRRKEFTIGYGETLLATDLNAGLIFLNRLNDVSVRDTLIHRNVDAIAKYDKEAARIWIQKISNPQLKYSATKYYEDKHY